MKELSEREKKVKELLTEDFSDMVSDSFEAEDLAVETGRIFREHGEDFDRNELEADLVFMLNRKGKSIVSLDEDESLLQDMIDCF